MADSRHEKHFVSFAAGFFLLSAPALAFAASSSEDNAEYVKKGRATYVRYCVACHGPSGKGDGPTASSLKTPPPDLTNISQKYHGFPTDKVMTWIDGEKASTAHGTREMPVWGTRFRRGERGEARALGEVYALTKYLESIQKR